MESFFRVESVSYDGKIKASCTACTDGKKPLSGAIGSTTLKQYPYVRDLFIKYNVALPSSAAVERLFSIAGMVATAKRNRLRPALFESLLQRVNNTANKYEPSKK